MLSSGYKPPQAIFAGNDYIAVACIRALTDSGYRLPEDVSIVGFDNLSISEMIRPALTSIDIPKTRIGALSVQRLHSLLEEGTLEKVKISLSTNLVIRESVNYSRSVESLGTANK